MHADSHFPVHALFLEPVNRFSVKRARAARTRSVQKERQAAETGDEGGSCHREDECGITSVCV